MPDASPYPPSVQALIDRLGRLPGIGKRSSERMAYHILSSSRDEAMDLAVAIRDVKKNIRACERCFNVAEEALCAVCADPSRDTGLICVVELPRDAIALEKTGAYRGLYHILQGRLNPAAGVNPEDLRIDALKRRLDKAGQEGAPVREVILATNPTTEGDATAAYLAEELARDGLTVTRLARGLASGTDLETTAPSSLLFALQGRGGWGAS